MDTLRNDRVKSQTQAVWPEMLPSALTTALGFVAVMLIKKCPAHPSGPSPWARADVLPGDSNASPPLAQPHGAWRQQQQDGDTVIYQGVLAAQALITAMTGFMRAAPASEHWQCCFSSRQGQA